MGCMWATASCSPHLASTKPQKSNVLGIYEGATENGTICTALLSDLVARGDRSTLFVIDGSKALVKATRAVFGQRAIVQRCQVHMRRNVEEPFTRRHEEERRTNDLRGIPF